MSDEASERQRWSDWHYHSDDPAAAMRHALGQRLTRAGRFAEARPYFDQRQQENLDQYAAHLAQVGRANTRATKVEGLRAGWLNTAGGWLKYKGDVQRTAFTMRLNGAAP